MGQFAAKRADVHGKVFRNRVASLAFWESEWLERGSSGKEVMPPGQWALGSNSRNERDLLPSD